jgi:hypothetical protein
LQLSARTSPVAQRRKTSKDVDPPASRRTQDSMSSWVGSSDHSPEGSSIRANPVRVSFDGAVGLHDFDDGIVVA